LKRDRRLGGSRRHVEGWLVAVMLSTIKGLFLRQKHRGVALWLAGYIERA
jgi:hypothetical protein